MNKIQEYQDIYNKLFKHNKLQAFFYDGKLLDTPLKFEKEYNNIIPFFDKLKISKIYNEELEQEIHFFIKKQNISKEEFFYEYIYTIDSWTREYALIDIIRAIDKLSRIMENILFAQYNDSFNYFYELAIFILFTRFERFPKEFENTLYYIQICEIIFNIHVQIGLKDNYFSKQKYFLKYIKLIGIDKYKDFLNEFYKYIILLYHDLSNNPKLIAETKDLYQIFIEQCKYSKLMPAKELEECLMLFAKDDLYNEDGLELLKEINSSYVEKYKSFLLMKDLI